MQFRISQNDIGAVISDKFYYRMSVQPLLVRQIGSTARKAGMPWRFLPDNETCAQFFDFGTTFSVK